MQWDTQTTYSDDVVSCVGSEQAEVRGRVTWRLEGNIGALATKCKPKQKITSPIATIKVQMEQSSAEEAGKDGDGTSPAPKDPTTQSLRPVRNCATFGLRLLVFPKGHVAPSTSTSGVGEEYETEYEPTVGLELLREDLGHEGEGASRFAPLSSADLDRNVVVSLVAQCDISNATDGSGSPTGGELLPSHDRAVLHRHTFSASQRIFPVPGTVVRYDTLRYSESLTVVVDIVVLHPTTTVGDLRNSLSSGLAAGGWNVMGSMGSVLQSVKDHSPLPSLAPEASHSVAPAAPTGVPGATSASKDRSGTAEDDGTVPVSASAASAFRFIGATLAEAASAVTNTNADTIPPTNNAPESTVVTRSPHNKGTLGEPSSRAVFTPAVVAPAPPPESDDLTETEEALWTLLFSMLHDPARLPIIELLCGIDCFFFACEVLPQVHARAQSQADSSIERPSNRALDATDPPSSELRLALQSCEALKAKRFSLVPRHVVEGEFWFNFLNNLGQVLGLRHLAELRCYMSAQSEALHAPGGIAATRRKPLPTSGLTKKLCDQQVDACLLQFRRRVEGDEHHRLTNELGGPETALASLAVIQECLIQFEEILRLSADSANNIDVVTDSPDSEAAVTLFASPNTWGDAASPVGGLRGPAQLSPSYQLEGYHEILEKLEQVSGLGQSKQGGHPTLGPLVRELKLCIAHLTELSE